MKWPLVLIAAVGCGRAGFDPIRLSDGALVDDAAQLDDAGNPIDAPGDGAGIDAAIDAAVQGMYTATFAEAGATGAPTARRSTGAATQPLTGKDRIWIYGGFSSAGFHTEIYGYDTGTNTWAQGATAGAPSARERHALAWDPVGNAVVVFGGQSSMAVNFTHYDALYVYRAGSGVPSWAQVPKSGSWPPARKDASLLWIPHLGRFLLYGGNDGGGAGNRFNDMWLLTLDAMNATGSWTTLTPGGIAAPAQSSGCVVYDPATHRVILFGGEVQDGSPVATTYQYLVDTNIWQQDSTTGTVPPGEAFNQCAWDPAINRVVLYGGQNTSGSPIGGTYLYDPTAKVWSVPTVMGADAGGRADGGATYSPARGGVLWFGGRTGLVTYTNQSWLLDVTVQ